MAQRIFMAIIAIICCSSINAWYRPIYRSAVGREDRLQKESVHETCNAGSRQKPSKPTFTMVQSSARLFCNEQLVERLPEGERMLAFIMVINQRCGTYVRLLPQGVYKNIFRFLVHTI